MESLILQGYIRNSDINPNEYECSIEARTQGTDLAAVLNPQKHYRELRKLELDTARLCALDKSLDIRSRYKKPTPC